MNYKWRSTIFLAFTAAFLITAPLVVLYTAGYRYQFGSARIVKTGILSISTHPKSATIFLEDKEQSKRSPNVIKNLRPGETHVRLEKTGYHTWDKTLTIGSGETTFLKEVILFLESEVEEYFEKTNVSDVIQMDKDVFVYSAKNGLYEEVWITDGPFGSDRFLAKTRHVPGATYTLSWSQDREYLMLKEAVGWKEKSVIVQVRSGDVVPAAINSTETAWWDTGSGHGLFVKSGTTLRLLNIDSNKIQNLKIKADAIQTAKNRFAVIQSTNDRSIVSYIDDSGVASIFEYLPLGYYRFVESAAGRILLEDTVRRRIILLDENNAQNPILLNTEATFWKWNENKDAIAYSNGFDLTVFSLLNQKTQTITRFSEPITEIAWYPIGGVLFFSQANRVLSIETDQRDNRNQLELAKDIQAEEIWFEKDGSKMYILGSKNGEPATIFEKQLQK